MENFIFVWLFPLLPILFTGFFVLVGMTFFNWWDAKEQKEQKMKAEKLNLENIVRELKRNAEKSLAPLHMIDMQKEEIAELKKKIEWYEKENAELKLKATATLVKKL